LWDQGIETRGVEIRSKTELCVICRNKREKGGAPILCPERELGREEERIDISTFVVLSISPWEKEWFVRALLI